MDSRAPQPLQFCLELSYTNLKNVSPQPVELPYVALHNPSMDIVRKSRAECAAKTLYHLRTTSARKPRAPYDFHGSLLRLHSSCTEIAVFPYNLRADSVGICPDLQPTRNGKTIVYQCKHICRSP